MRTGIGHAPQSTGARNGPENKKIVERAKSVPCADCGERYPSYVMDFDHVRGVKVANIAQLKVRGSAPALRAEIDKCEVVCANCHRIRSHERSQAQKE